MKLYGADVKPGGEEADDPRRAGGAPNKRPVGAVKLRRTGDQLVFDGSTSRDPDGTITSWDWYVAGAAADTVHQGEVVSIPATAEPRTITLVVTDNGGLTDFVTVTTVPMDVKPDSCR